MPNRVRVNLANPAELLELPGIGPEQARAILNFRAEHGPIQDAGQLANALRPWPIPEARWERAAFGTAEATAPVAPVALQARHSSRCRSRSRRNRRLIIVPPRRL